MSLLTPLRSAAPVALIAALGLLLPTTARADHGGHGGGGHGGGGHGDYHGHGGYSHGGGRYWHGGGYGYGYGYGYPFFFPDFGYYGGGGYYGGFSGPSWGYDGRPYGYDSRYDAGAPGNLAVDVQRSLKHHGYYNGPVDGEIGAGSRNAIRNFQADHHLDATGRIDQHTLHALGM